MPAPPHNPEAEIAVLSAFLSYPEYLGQGRGMLEPVDFWLEIHRDIFTAMLNLHELGEKIDMVTVHAEALHFTTYKSQNGLIYLKNNILACNALAANWQYHARIVKNCARRRKIINQCQSAIDMAYADADADTVIQSVKQTVNTLESEERAEDWPDNAAIANRIYETAIRKNESGDHALGVLTGLHSIDRYMHGLPAGCTIYLGGKSTSGKSALALTICQRIDQNPDYSGAILYFTFESSETFLTVRRFAWDSQIPSTRIQTGNLRSDEEIYRLQTTRDRIVQSNLYVFDHPRFRQFETLAGFIENAAARHKIELIVADYFQLMKIRGRYASQHAMYKEIVTCFNDLAKIVNVPIMILSQLNKEGELKESGDIFNNADHVWMLNRENQEAEVAHLVGQKAKDIGPWSTQLRFHRYIQRFSDL
jgi:replicative DNA helicase